MVPDGFKTYTPWINGAEEEKRLFYTNESLYKDVNMNQIFKT